MAFWPQQGGGRHWKGMGFASSMIARYPSDPTLGFCLWRKGGHADHSHGLALLRQASRQGAP